MKAISKGAGRLLGVGKKAPPINPNGSISRPVGGPVATVPMTVKPIDNGPVNSPEQKQTANVRARQRRPSLVYGAETGITQKRETLG